MWCYVRWWVDEEYLWGEGRRGDEFIGNSVGVVFGFGFGLWKWKWVGLGLGLSWDDVSIKGEEGRGGS